MSDIAQVNFIQNLKTYMTESVRLNKKEAQEQSAEVAAAKSDQIRSMKSSWTRKARSGPNAFAEKASESYEGNQYERTQKSKTEKARPNPSS
jgi:hypothetical protein